MAKSAFDPEGSDFDYQTAKAYNMQPKKKGQHWGSVAPTSDDERIANDLPENSYVVLKGKQHETFNKAEAAEKARGSKIEKKGSRYYSVPMSKGGTASSRADGIAQRGRTKGRVL